MDKTERKATMKEERIRSGDGTELYCSQWIPAADTPVKGCALVLHGMADHAARFSSLAAALSEAGYAVYAYDQRGHGRTAGSDEAIGIIADSDGMDLLVEDARLMISKLREDFGAVPVFLIAHSMGSFVAQGFAQRYGDSISGMVLSGSNGSIGVMADLAKLVAKNEIKKHGRNRRSEKLNTLSFGSFNNRFRPNRTAFDWLSSVDAEVDKYVGDPWCGGVFTAGFFYDLADFLKRIHQKRNLEKVPANLPIALFSGDVDPVGGRKGAGKLYREYKKRGVADLSLKLYPNARHEILNEKNREEVEQDILGWISARSGSARRSGQ